MSLLSLLNFDKKSGKLSETRHFELGKESPSSSTGLVLVRQRQLLRGLRGVYSMLLPSGKTIMVSVIDIGQLNDAMLYSAHEQKRNNGHFHFCRAWSVSASAGTVHPDGLSLLLSLDVPTSQPLMWGGKKLNDGTWKLPRVRSIAKKLDQAYPSLVWEEGSRQTIDERYGFPVTPLDLPEREGLPLFSFQREAIEFLVHSPLPGSLLALSPGLGKTACTIIAARYLQLKRVLIVAPLTFVKTRTWQKESALWGGEEIADCYGRGPAEEGWCITNYETVSRQWQKYASKWDLIVLDESIMVKNRGTKRVGSVRRLRPYAAKIWALSGYPISKYADDLWSQFQLIFPSAFRSYWRFAHEYTVVWRSPWGMQITGSRAEIDYQDEFADLMFVRNQENVLDLPPILSELVEVDLLPEQRRVHDELLDNFVSTLSSGEKVEVVVKTAQITKLLQVTSHLANLSADPWSSGGSAKASLLKELFAKNIYELPAIIWVHWRKGAQALYKRLSESLPTSRVSLVLGGQIDAGTLILDFQEGRSDILILGLTVGKYGHTLTRARTVFYFDRIFDMDAFLQSQKRTHRIGTTHSPVVVTVKAVNSADQYVEDNLAGKAPGIADISDENLVGLLTKLRGPN